MLRLLQPIEDCWKHLARKLLRDDQQDKVNTIESDCFHKDASHKALDDVFSTWRGNTRRAQRTWETLCNIVEEYNKGEVHNDQSLEEYIKANSLKSKFHYMMKKGAYNHSLYPFVLSNPVYS